MSRNEADSALRFYPVDLGYQAWDSHEVPRALLRIFRASWAAGRGQLQRGRDFFFFFAWREFYLRAENSRNAGHNIGAFSGGLKPPPCR